MPATTQQTKADRLTDLWSQREKAERAALLARAVVHDVQEQIAEEDGDVLRADWHRLQSLAIRTDEAQDQAAADAAWLRMMVAHHRAMGTRAEAHRCDEINAALDNDCPCQGTGTLVADAPCRCQSEALGAAVCGYSMHAEVAP
jgi:coenzyme F420-reducing hydrogenase gamma subunit